MRDLVVGTLGAILDETHVDHIISNRSLYHFAFIFYTFDVDHGARVVLILQSFY